MRYDMFVTAYDVMGSTHISLSVRVTDDTPEQDARKVVAVVDDVQLDDDLDPYTWARDALVAIVERF